MVAVVVAEPNVHTRISRRIWIYYFPLSLLPYYICTGATS